MQTVLNDAFRKVIERYDLDEDNSVMTELCIQVKPVSGEMIISNDDDEVIASVVVPDWAIEETSDFYIDVAKSLRKYLNEQKTQWEKLSIIKPYSFILVDEDKETIEELCLVDDNIMMFEEVNLMKDLDKELQSFFDKLMNE